MPTAEEGRCANPKAHAEGGGRSARQYSLMSPEGVSTVRPEGRADGVVELVTIALRGFDAVVTR